MHHEAITTGDTRCPLELWLFEAGWPREYSNGGSRARTTKLQRTNMKPMRLLTVSICTFALVAGASLLRADDEKKPCCAATVEAGKTCQHECCKKAAADAKVCEKCHPKKDEKN